MVLTASRNAFWVRYQPEEDESLEETLTVVDKVLYGDRRTKTTGKGGYFGGVLLDGDGHEVVDLVICMPSRVAVSSVLNPDKWRRKGARGTFRDGKYPEESETAHRFVKRWCDAMNVKAFTREVGSRDEANRVLKQYYDRENRRMRQKRGDREISKPRGLRTRKQIPCARSPSEVPTVEVSHDTGNRVADLRPSVQTFVDLDFDFSLPVEGLYCVFLKWNGSEESSGANCLFF